MKRLRTIQSKPANACSLSNAHRVKIFAACDVYILHDIETAHCYFLQIICQSYVSFILSCFMFWGEYAITLI